MANYGIEGGFSDTQDNTWYFKNKYSVGDTGPYVGVVKNTIDPLRMGRLGVHIPALSKTEGETRSDGAQKIPAESLIWCQYLSPFYGAKPFRATSKTDPYNYQQSQTAYGMWAIPPDVDTNVLVIFAKGEKGNANAFWIGCIQEPLTNQQVPGLGATVNTVAESQGGDFSQSKEDIYGTTILPAGEKNKNKNMFADGETVESANQWKYPINTDLADQLMRQGLVADQVRGTTTSSARRESPSAVFGINTPGRIKADSRTPNVGLDGTPLAVDRAPGHSFVMDDGAADGTNQLTRLRTASGHQLLMHDTEGVVYIANGSGNAWIEMNSEGRIDVYSGIGGINMRTQGDFNLHSDANINMHAGGQIRMSATNEIVKSAGTYMLNLGDKGIFNSSQKGSIRDYARDGLTSYTDGQQLHGAGGQIHLAGAQVHFNSTGASDTWGPKWLDTDAASMTERQEGDVELAKKGIEPLRPFTKQTSTTVHRFVTHEPMPRLRGFTSEGAMPTGGADNKKAWYRLASTPGTVEYTEQRNRTSNIESIRLGQFQADAEKVLREQMGTSTDAAKARKILADFGKEYDEAFDIANQSRGKWDTAASISNKLKGFDVADSVSEVLNNNTKKLADQVIDTVTGSEVAELFKDNVFVNQAGELFALGDKTQLYSGDFKGFATDVGSKAVANIANENLKKAVGDLTKRKVIGTDKFGNPIYKGLDRDYKNIGGIDISGITGNINIANIASAGDLKATTNVFKNVVAGQVTSTIQTTAINAVASQAKGFLAGLGGSTARELGRQGITPGRFTNLGAKIGAMKLPASLGGSVTGAFTAVKTFFSGFSDVRLKEDIRLIGRSPSGINIYEFKYKHTSGTWQGVMAQEVPWARTMTDTGYYMVDYSKVDVEFRRIH
jgi:hypothetical protein